MPARIIRTLLERSTTLDKQLDARFARRGVDKAVAHLAMRRHRFGPVGSAPSGQRDVFPIENTGIVLGGLDIEYSSNSSITVRPGKALMVNPSPGSETRPGAWIGKIEPDDFGMAMPELVSAATVAPANPITTATTGVELWWVYVTMSEEAVENASGLQKFNTSTGEFDSIANPKVVQHVLTPHVLRGSPGDPPPGLALGSLPIALLIVPAGSTNLSKTVFCDVRKLAGEYGGPNVIGGHWTCPVTGELMAPYTTGSGKRVFHGDVWAWVGGEMLEVRARTGFFVTDLLEPGASWDATASATAPKVAWLYLTKVGGFVPRPTRRGASTISNNGSFPAETNFASGALVLSPTPPRIGCASADTHTAQRWDLRSSDSLTLSSMIGSGDLFYPWAGVEVAPDDAVCLGFLTYTSVDVGANVPRVNGPVYVDPQGWMSGDGLNLNAATSPVATVTPTAPGLNVHAQVALNGVTVGSMTWAFPISAVRLLGEVQFTNATDYVQWSKELLGFKDRSTGSGSYLQRVSERHFAFPGDQQILDMLTGGFGGVGSPAPTQWNVSALAVRFPFGEPLIT